MQHSDSPIGRMFFEDVSDNISANFSIAPVTTVSTNTMHKGVVGSRSGNIPIHFVNLRVYVPAEELGRGEEWVYKQYFAKEIKGYTDRIDSIGNKLFSFRFVGAENYDMRLTRDNLHMDVKVSYNPEGFHGNLVTYDFVMRIGRYL